MSRIGKLPIKLADKVKATVQGDKVNFDGPKGKLSVKLPIEGIKGEIKGMVAEGKAGQSRDIAEVTAAPPDQSKAIAKPVTPMGPEPVGAPALPQLRRHGFTVVEWGGADLDEPRPAPAAR